MTFKDITIKNLKANIKKYISYFLCNSFAVMVFFMFSTVMFNDKIHNQAQDPATKMILQVFMVVIAIISTFFITYSHTTFTTHKSKEFGLFLVFGMSKRQITQMIVYENILIGSASILIGMISGTVFAKLFYISIVRLMEIEDVGFYLNPKSFFVTLAVFSLVFAMVTILGAISTRKMQITHMLKKQRKTSFKPVKLPWLGLVGVIAVILTFVFLRQHLEDKLFKNNNFFMLFLLITLIWGIYVIITQFGSFLLTMEKRIPKLYYRNIVSSSSIAHRFSQNKKIMFIICILSAAIVFYIGAIYAIYTATGNQITKEYPYDIAYSEVHGRNSINEATLKSIITTGETKLLSSYDAEFLHLTETRKTEGRNAYQLTTYSISESTYNSLAKDKLKLNKGEAVKLYQTVRSPEVINDSLQETLCFKEIEMGTLNIINSIYKIVFNNTLFGAYELLIINDQDYNTYKEKVTSEYIGQHHLYKFDDWRKTGNIIKALDTALIKANSITVNYSVSNSAVNNMALSTSISKLKRYMKDKQQNSLAFFISCFIGLLSFFSCGSIMYLKITSDIQYEKQKYRKLYLIGIKSKELKKTVSRELAAIFFVPVVIGSLVGLALFGTLLISDNNGIEKQLISSCLVVAVVYWALQLVFYMITKNKYIKEISVGNI